VLEERLQEWCSTIGDSGPPHYGDDHGSENVPRVEHQDERSAVGLVYWRYVKPDITALHKMVSRCLKPRAAVADHASVHRFLCTVVSPDIEGDEEGTTIAVSSSEEKSEQQGRARVPSRNGAARNDRDRYDFLVETLFPQLRSWAAVTRTGEEDAPEGREADWEGLKRHLAPVGVVDPCVHSFTKPGYLRRKDLIYASLYLELGLERRPANEPEAAKKLEEVEDNGQGRHHHHRHQGVDPGEWRWPAEKDDVAFFLLYRGTRSLRRDSPLLGANDEEEAKGVAYRYSAAAKMNPARAHSLSYGLGLFAGVMQDSSATPYNYMRKRAMEAYALKIPRREFHDDPPPADTRGESTKPHLYRPSLARRLFFVPPLPAVVMLRGLGELFHPRGRVCLHAPDQAQDRPGPESHAARGECAGRNIATRAHFVSGVLACSYAALPTFLATDARAVAAFPFFVSTHAHLLTAAHSCPDDDAHAPTPDA
jgi:hypothetical protein